MVRATGTLSRKPCRVALMGFDCGVAACRAFGTVSGTVILRGTRL